MHSGVAIGSSMRCLPWAMLLSLPRALLRVRTQNSVFLLCVHLRCGCVQEAPLCKRGCASTVQGSGRWVGTLAAVVSALAAAYLASNSNNSSSHACVQAHI